MCGISGYIDKKRTISNTEVILNMLKVQRHRGPDDSGIRAFSILSGNSHEFNVDSPAKIEGSFEGILGFNRLSILDLSINGHQPMTSPGGDVILTLNGEIYNAFDYQNELEDWGYKFRSTTDTEIVLALYLKYGFEETLDRLNGMFAIVIVDLRQDVVFVTRDRFGIKPMYYVNNSDHFAFSSELKSFKFLEGFEFSLNNSQLDEFLLFRNNLNGTLFHGIESLEPGHYLRYEKAHGLKQVRYFNPNSFSRNGFTNGDLAYYGEQMESWLDNSVQRQLMSDVKLGCQLSGGVDSSLVTWLANRNSKKGNFESVSIVFNNPKYTEELYVDQVADKLGITAHKFLLDGEYYLDQFEKASWHLEAPINHPNTLGIYKLSQRAKEYVTVLLSGEGADEVFGGYARFYDLAYPYRLRNILHEFRKNLSYLPGVYNYFKADIRSVLATAYMTPGIAKNVLNNFNYRTALESRVSLYRSLSGSYFDKQVKYELQSFLPDLLIRQDKMSMAHSIENRVPFLDNEIVENSFKIPEKLLLLRKSPEGINTEKYLLKKMSSKVFGNAFAFRNKMGFGIPVREFFMNERFQAYLNEAIVPGIRARGIFNEQLIKKWISSLNRLNYLEMEALWIVVSFEVWASIYLNNNGNYWNTSH